MATILQIETATQVCSAAVSVNGKTIALKEEMASNIHAGSLTLFIKEVMDTAGLQFTDLDAVSVSKGPGSYTGLRIGVSTAKGLCFALDKPLIAVDTLQMMAAGFLVEQAGAEGLICAMIDARRMEVFTAVFDADLNYVLPTEAKIIDENSFAAELALGKVTFIGDGAMKCAAVLQHENAAFSELNFNSAAYMSQLAYKAFTAAQFEDVAYFEPFYLKDFVLTTPKKKV
ncbi:MAG: tRNA (adenosine(37)-N6)-threonylcarbamoyltransferase complex dimerization subunit type 1 TsaB [Candidatus Pedobacter colombiensis]|uniref:tRNA (Adenosine(37)-N6)-threonylcarbamoyltransferase complex dimerization subunit type 1 TsaB n=1 Tax=Candidatus Pedobacter colombiensis TaxID=3121371 RepID=A0AAJ5WAH2_9SPHI|nr:tRNA (adenosine(37)-N6)-threonylcarbamoyltransferase complex dimerization subunit type 1 TsaB [Pedobacter sp.]WEK20765.1 MAG: tRNA (adenosine(37)-N6)-threonylcarbamoyltransferase complex dimerization subunit type 1 TsaB [Pedobacter sp.]